MSELKSLLENARAIHERIRKFRQGEICLECEDDLTGKEFMQYPAGRLCKECFSHKGHLHTEKHIVNIRSKDGEYRVPGPARTEAQACYTDDPRDAVGTAISEWARAGIYNIKVKVNGRKMKWQD